MGLRAEDLFVEGLGVQMLTNKGTKRKKKVDNDMETHVEPGIIQGIKDREIVNDLWDLKAVPSLCSWIDRTRQGSTLLLSLASDPLDVEIPFQSPTLYRIP